jgi:proteasome assembly chaperone (PAC2) family protein
VLIAAFRGWNDGAQAASLAASFLAKTWNAERFADIDPEDFFDFQAVRPHVSLVDGVTRQIDWPENAFYDASMPGAVDADGRDAVLLLGVEPNTHWRTFTSEIIELSQNLEVELVITLGALLADVPHTRPSPVTGAATDAQLVEELGLTTSRYEGPTGIVGVLHDACREASLASASLWAAVPHYASMAPSPRAAHALCARLSDLVDTELDLDELERAGDVYEKQVSEAVSADEETAAYVQELERRADELAAEAALPSGDTLAAELTRFLQEHEARGREEEEEE